MNLFLVPDLHAMLYVFTQKMVTCFMQLADISNIPEAMTLDISDMVSTSDIGQSSMVANYGDVSCDQCSLGK